MKLLPKKLLRKLQAQDPYHPSGPGRELHKDEELVLAKWFTPDANWTWWAVSASQDEETGDVQLFGLVEGLDPHPELGYFWLSQLKQVFGTLGLPVERDIHWEPIPLDCLMEDMDRAA